MIEIKNIREVKSTDGYDEVWAIVRSMKSQTSWIKQVPELSPSEDLFFKYLSLKRRGEWGEDAFANIYLPQFLKEMQDNEAKKKLAYLFDADKTGKRIALLCFCPEEKLCHRSIIAGLLQGAGAEVKAQANYGRYFSLWKEAGK